MPPLSGAVAVGAGTFSPGWRHQPGLKVFLVPGVKNSGTRVHFDRGSKVCSLLVFELAVIGVFTAGEWITSSKKFLDLKLTNQQ